MIGADIIPLSVGTERSEEYNLRRLSKILNPKEQYLLKSEINPALLFCLLWSIKESGYKLLHKRGLVKTFSPKKYICHVDIPETNRIVRLDYSKKNVRIKAQNAVIALATASICNEELCIFFHKIVDNPIRLGYIAQSKADPWIGGFSFGTITYPVHIVLSADYVCAISADSLVTLKSTITLRSSLDRLSNNPSKAIRDVANNYFSNHSTKATLVENDNYPQLYIEGQFTSCSISHHIPWGVFAYHIIN